MKGNIEPQSPYFLGVVKWHIPKQQTMYSLEQAKGNVGFHKMP